MMETVTVRDLMSREYVGVSEGDDLRETVEVLVAEDAECAVVLRGTDPVGFVSPREVLRVVAGDGDSGDLTVADVMERHVPLIGPNEPVTKATSRMAQDNVHRLVVTDAVGEPLGVLTDHDVVAASALRAANGDEDEDQRAEATARAMGAGGGATAVTEAATPEEYSTQGICEVCGSLTRDLSSFNGQLVCADCKNV